MGRLFAVLAVLALAGCPGEGKVYPSYSSADIPDPGVGRSSIGVEHNFQVTDLDILVWLSHDRLEDCQAWVVSPRGTPVRLFYHLSGRDLKSTTFDDEAGAAIDRGRAPYRGHWRVDSRMVDDALSNFDGEWSYGNWTLYVQDERTGESGVIESWALIFNRE